MQHQRLRCEYRTGIDADIRKLEWHGEFFDHREIIEQAFSAQAAGKGLVLVAAVNDFPVAQLWARFENPDRPPRWWAFRVMKPYQRFGVGATLLCLGENVLARHRFGNCEIGVEKANIEARRFYEEQGYQLSYEQLERYSYITPAGERREGAADQWILCKKLPLVRRGWRRSFWRNGKTYPVVQFCPKLHPMREPHFRCRSAKVKPRKHARIQADKMRAGAAQFRIVGVER